MAPFDCKYQNIHMSHTQSSCRFRDINISNLLPSKVGQGHVVQFPQLHHSMADVKVYKCLQKIFALALNVSKIERKLIIFYLQKVGQGYGVQFWQLHHSMANIRKLQIASIHFYASSYRFGTCGANRLHTSWLLSLLCSPVPHRQPI